MKIIISWTEEKAWEIEIQDLAGIESSRLRYDALTREQAIAVLESVLALEDTLRWKMI